MTDVIKLTDEQFDEFEKILADNPMSQNTALQALLERPKPWTESKNQPRDLAIYRAVLDPQGLGLNSEGDLITGLRLDLVFTEGHNVLDQHLDDLGTEATASIYLPDGGLLPDQLYTPTVTNISRDWESGIIDQWDISLIPYTGDIPAGGDE